MQQQQMDTNECREKKPLSIKIADLKLFGLHYLLKQDHCVSFRRHLILLIPFLMELHEADQLCWAACKKSVVCPKLTHCGSISLLTTSVCQ